MLTPYLSMSCRLCHAALLHCTRADIKNSLLLASQVAQLPAQLVTKATRLAGSKGDFEG